MTIGSVPPSYSNPPRDLTRIASQNSNPSNSPRCFFEFPYDTDTRCYRILPGIWRSQVTHFSVGCFNCSITKGFLIFPVDVRRSPGVNESMKVGRNLKRFIKMETENGEEVIQSILIFIFFWSSCWNFQGVHIYPQLIVSTFNYQMDRQCGLCWNCGKLQRNLSTCFHQQQFRQ